MSMNFKKIIVSFSLLIGCFGSNAVASDWRYDEPFNRQFFSTANLIIELRDGAKRLTGNVKLGAFCHDKLRGVKSPSVRDSIVYLTIHGEDDEVMDFRVLLEDGTERKLHYTYTYVSDDMVGWEIPWQINIFCIRAIDVNPGGVYAAKGSLAGKSHLPLVGNWTANDITRLKYAAAAPDGTTDEVRSLDLTEASLVGGAPAGGWLAAFPNVGSVETKKLPAGMNVSEFLEGANPNVLLYLPETTMVSPQSNVVIGTKALRLNLTDGAPFYALHTFKAQNARYIRSFSLPTIEHRSAGWETITLPFRPSAYTSAKGKLAPFGSAEIAYDMYTSTHPEGYRPFWLRCPDGTSFTRAIEIQPYKAYIISMPNSNTYQDSYNITGDVAFTATDVRVMATPDKMPVEGTAAFSLVPTLRKVKAGNQVYVLNRPPVSVGNLAAGSAFVRNSGDALPFRAYAAPRNEHGVAPYFLIEHNEITAIGRLSRPVPPSSSAAYDLTGRKLTGSERGLQIINHKKVIVR